MKTITFPHLPDQAGKALAITGRTVTVEGKFQARVICVEGDTWTTVHADNGSTILDLDCTLLTGHEDPSVYYLRQWQDPWDGTITETGGWARLSQVSKGVCLTKG